MTSVIKDTPSTHGGKRNGAGRPPKNKSAEAGPLDTGQGAAGSDPADFKAVLYTTVAAVEGLPRMLGHWTKPVMENLGELMRAVKRFEFEMGGNLRDILEQRRTMESQLEEQSDVIDLLLREQKRASERATMHAAALEAQIAELEAELRRTTQAMAVLKVTAEATHAHVTQIIGTVEVVEAAVPTEAIAAAIREAFVDQHRRQLAALAPSPPRPLALKPSLVPPRARAAL